MRLGLALAVVGLSLLATGCRLACDISRNLAFEACYCADKVKSTIYYRRLANDAWAQYSGSHAEQAGCKAFAQGFKDGYADYLEGGGPVNCAPPLPPQRFWKCKYQTPEGRAATEAWFAGFKEGAAAAKASGYRNYIIVPIGKCDPQGKGVTPPAAPVTPAPAAIANPPGTAVIPTPALPPGSSLPPPPVPAEAPGPELPTPRTLPGALPPAGAGPPGAGTLQGPQVRQEQDNLAVIHPIENPPSEQTGRPLSPGSAGPGPAALPPSQPTPPGSAPPAEAPRPQGPPVRQEQANPGEARPPESPPAEQTAAPLARGNASSGPAALPPSTASLAVPPEGMVATTPGSSEVVLVVSLPADAELFIADKATHSRGPTRAFVSPKLEGGRSYTYELKGEVLQNGQMRSASQSVQVEPGRTTYVNLTFPDTASSPTPPASPAGPPGSGAPGAAMPPPIPVQPAAPPTGGGTPATVSEWSDSPPAAPPQSTPALAGIAP